MMTQNSFSARAGCRQSRLLSLQLRLAAHIMVSAGHDMGCVCSRDLWHTMWAVHRQDAQSKAASYRRNAAQGGMRSLVCHIKPHPNQRIPSNLCLQHETSKPESEAPYGCHLAFATLGNLKSGVWRENSFHHPDLVHCRVAFGEPA